MILFLAGLVFLIVGYYTYGRFVERIIGPDNRMTPGEARANGVDYVILPHWKNMLIQLLNIAGVGPVIGVILGIKFGSIVFIVLPIGNVIAGATHDFLGGMMSIRNGGANLPKLIRKNLGWGYYRFFSIFMVLLLLLVVAVFINIPANLIGGLLPGDNPAYFWGSVAAVFLYYIAATLFPVDKIIGRIYPFFGALLLLSTAAIFIALLWKVWQNPALLTESAAFQEKMWRGADYPIVPLLFVTIACGIISGFHATQSPIIARTVAHEREGRSDFYGMMIVEGVIGMIWAGAGMVIYNLFPETMLTNPTSVLLRATSYFLGGWMGVATILGVIVLAVTSGDTALRSTRLALAEMLNYSQRSLLKRIWLCLPLIAVVAALLWWSNLSARSFNNLWNYFSWGNQVLAASTLLAAAVWLWRQRKFGWVAAVPAAFMIFVVASYILWISPAHKGPLGGGLPLEWAYALAGAVTTGAVIWAWRLGRRRNR